MRNKITALFVGAIVAVLLTMSPARAASPSYSLTLSAKYPALYQSNYGFADNFIVDGGLKLYDCIPGVNFYANGMYNAGNPANAWYYPYVTVGTEVNLGGGFSLFVEGERRYTVNDNAVFAGVRFFQFGDL